MDNTSPTTTGFVDNSEPYCNNKDLIEICLKQEYDFYKVIGVNMFSTTIMGATLATVSYCIENKSLSQIMGALSIVSFGLAAFNYALGSGASTLEEAQKIDSSSDIYQHETNNYSKLNITGMIETTD